MNFLKKLGLAIAKGALATLKLTPYGQIVVGLLPSGRPQDIANTILGDLNTIARAVGTAEVMTAAVNGDTSGLGSQKLQMARPFVTALVNQWLASSFPHQGVKDQVKFAAGVDKITGGVADVMSSLGE